MAPAHSTAYPGSQGGQLSSLPPWGESKIYWWGRHGIRERVGKGAGEGMGEGAGKEVGKEAGDGAGERTAKLG